MASGTAVCITETFITLLILMLSGFDRDLGIAGRAMVRAEDGSIVPKLVKIDRPSKSLREDSLS